MDAPLNLLEVERLALDRLPPMARDYYAGGADDEVTLRENRAAFGRIPLHYRVLVDVSRRELGARVLGEPVALPVLVAPTAFQRLAHADGELATARAAGAAGTVVVLSTLSTATVEDVVAASTGPVWFQLYVYRDRAATADLVRRAEAAGCRALVLTADAPVLGRRERDVRNRFSLPEGVWAANLLAAGMHELPPEAQGGGLQAYFSSLLDPSLSWRDLEWLRSLTRLPVVIKGVVRADDARRAVDAGAAAVIVSNHGGRQLDSAPAAIDALPAVVAAVAGRAEVYVDGGVRRGTDIVKALALGARAVLIGRPVLWGLALAGQQGVAAVFDMLRAELDRALALCGCARIADIGPDLVAPAG